MKRRWKWWAGLCLVLLATIGLLALPAVHWPLLGWLRGEAFYRGRPTSYWQREVARLEPHGGGLLISYDDLPTPTIFGGGIALAAAAAPARGVDWWNAFLDLVGLNRPVPPDELPGWLVLYGRTPAAAMASLSSQTDEDSFIDDATLPVKRELLQRHPAFVRCMVLRFLSFQTTNERFPLFQAALQDGDRDVRLEAAFRLWRFSRRTPGAGLPHIPFEQLVPVFAQGLEHENAWVQTQCANVLGNGGAAAKVALPALRDALRKAEQDDSVAREAIAAALQAIDPEAVPKTSGK